MNFEFGGTTLRCYKRSSQAVFSRPRRTGQTVLAHRSWRRRVEGAPTGGPRRTSCACRVSRFWRPGVTFRQPFALGVTFWCQSTDLMEYIKMHQVPFNFMKVEPSYDGLDYSRLTEPQPSPSSGQAVPTRTHLCWPPGRTKVRVDMPSEQPHYAWESPLCSLVSSGEASMAASS